MEFRVVRKDELPELWKLARDYVDEGIGFDEVTSLYSIILGLFVGCYENGEMIGMCMPGLTNGELFIKAIAVKQQYWRKGIGSRLLELFEENARKLGKSRITVGSADIEWVERFYMKNGFRPALLRISMKGDIPGHLKQKFSIINERT